MREHAWEVEYVDAGHIDGHFWRCPTCGCSGGIAWPAADGGYRRDGAYAPRAFMGDMLGTLDVSNDCDTARIQIETAKVVAAHFRQEPVRKQIRTDYLRRQKPKPTVPQTVAALLEEQYREFGARGDLARRFDMFCPWADLGGALLVDRSGRFHVFKADTEEVVKV